MAELEYGVVRGRYLLVQSNVSRSAAGTVLFTAVEPDEIVDVPEETLYSRQSVEAVFDGDGWIHAAGTPVDYLRLPVGRWEVSFRQAKGLTIGTFQFDVTADETVNLPAVAPIKPSPAVKFVVNELVYTETLDARDETFEARDVAVQAAADAVAPTNTVVDARIALKRGAANGVAALGSDSKLPETQVPDRLSASALSSTIGAVIAPVAAGAALSRPRGGRVVLMGDSITAYNGGTSTSTPPQSLSGFSSVGMWRWAAVMLGQRIDIIGNSGIGGQETAQIRARFQTDVLNLTPDIVALLAGTNDDGPEDETWANLSAMYDAALAAGIFIVAFTIPPQTSAVSTNNPTMQAYRQQVNASIRQYVKTHPGMLLVDLANVWQDKTVGGFVGRADYLLDGTHPGTLGAQVAGYAVARAVAPILPESVQPMSIATAPDNMLTNGRFAGTGTAAPSGWNLTGSATVGYVPGPNGIGQRLALTVPVGGSATLTQNVNRGVLLREGDAYDFTVSVEAYDLEAPGASTQRINAFTQNYDGSSFARIGDAVYIDGGATYGSARFPAKSGTFRTQRGVLTTGKTLAQVVVSIFGGGTYLISDAVARNLTMLEAGLTAPENVPQAKLITNGTFETDAADWSANAGAVVARTTTQKRSGVASLSVQHTADLQSDARYKKVGAAGGVAMNYVAWINAPAAFVGKINANWYVGGGSFISQTGINFTGTGQWQKIIGTIAASSVPANAGDMLITIGRGDAVGTPLVYVDDVDFWQS